MPLFHLNLNLNALQGTKDIYLHRNNTNTHAKLNNNTIKKGGELLEGDTHTHTHRLHHFCAESSVLLFLRHFSVIINFNQAIRRLSIIGGSPILLPTIVQNMKKQATNLQSSSSSSLSAGFLCLPVLIIHCVFNLFNQRLCCCHGMAGLVGWLAGL